MTGPVQLDVVQTGAGVSCQLLRYDRAIASGTTDGRLVISRSLGVELTVVEANTGVPVEDYAVQCEVVADHTWGSMNARSGGHHPDGRLLVGGLTRGRRHALRVIPADRALGLSERLTFDV